MSSHLATIRWQRNEHNFLDRRYSRAHHWQFDGGVIVPASSSPHVVPVPMSDESLVDPEEAFVASLSSCHMLFFLDFACRNNLVVEDYMDTAMGVMSKNEAGKFAMTKVTLKPKVIFSQLTPESQTIIDLHHKAHEACFIANSVTTDVVVEPVY